MANTSGFIASPFENPYYSKPKFAVRAETNQPQSVDVRLFVNQKEVGFQVTIAIRRPRALQWVVAMLR